MDPTLILLIFLIILSWFFSWAEIALISLSPAKIKQLVDWNKFWAKTIQKLKSSPNKLLITILIWNNLVNIWASMITAIWANTAFWSEYLAVVTWILTLFVLIFWEILPKSLAQKYNVWFSSIVAKPIYFLEIFLFPIVWILEKFLSFTMKFFWAWEKLASLTEEELKAMVQLWNEEGMLDDKKSEMLENVLDFWEITAEEIMTDKAKLQSIPSDFTVKQTVDFFIKNDFSRLPVYKNNENKIIWIITIQEIIKHNQTNNWDEKLENITLKEPLFVPETKKIAILFKELQWKRMHMSVVIDEFWEVSWIVTMEDILEEVFWEIHDESDEERWKVKKINETSWRVDWDAEIEKLNKELNTIFETPEHKNISFLLLDKMQKIPERGENCEINWFHFYIEKMNWNKIELVRVQKI